MIKRTITINANLETVWNALLSYRTADPDKRKVISSEGNRTVVEEKFAGLPVVGSSRVKYEEIEAPMERVDYKLIDSDKLSKFEGAWVLRPQGEDKVEAELTTLLDSALPLPFKENFLKTQANSDMDKRLNYLKNKAEGK
jgi:Polyketide cyclase / dehydrase and lipid transport.